MKTRLSILALLVVAALPCLQACGDWTSFRNGGSSSAEKLPTHWSPDNIAWQLELTGYGQSTPVILGEKVFAASVVGPMKEQCLVQCFDLKSGSELWQFSCPSTKRVPSNYMASRAAPTPVVDEKGLYVFFETGDLVALDLSGKKLWQRVLSEEFGEFENNHGLGSSPAQNASHLFLNLEHKGPSHLVALNKSDGETDWTVDRPSGSSWSSPIVVDSEGSAQVLVSSAGAVTSYDASGGQELWSVDGLDGNSVPSPTVSSGKLFIGARLPEFAEEGSIRSNCCLNLASLSSGAPEIIWKADKAISDYASPVVAGDFVYFINKVGVLHCLDVNSGEMHYRKRLSGSCWATPLVSGSSVYLFCKDGMTQVIEASKEFKLVAENRIWDPTSPPKPETYVENKSRGGHGHGSHGQSSSSAQHGASKSGDLKSTTSKSGPPAGASRRPGGGMIAALMRGDANGDGILEGDEISKDFQPMLARVDKNKDGKLDAKELEAMAKSFAERRAGARTGAADPIVYGIAASDGNIVIRTGTRLYCVR